jgi:[ribosomal protein S5]-alanine N-acetyltransferase
MIPTYALEHVILRPLQEYDFADFFEYAQDPRVSEPGMWLPYVSEDVARDDFVHILSLYERGLMWWAIEHRVTGKMIGKCQLSDHDADDRRAEISYALHPDFWGQGLMSESIKTTVQYGFEDFDLYRIGAKVYTNNIGSIRVLEKIGMSREGCLRGYRRVFDAPKDVFVYSILRDEWRA